MKYLAIPLLLPCEIGKRGRSEMSNLPAIPNEVASLPLPALGALEDADRQRVITLAHRFTEWLGAGRPQELITTAAAETGLSAGAVRTKFYKAAKTGTMDCFVPSKRKDKGKARNWHPLALEYLKTRAGVCATYESAYKQTKAVAESKGWQIGSLRSAQRYLQQHAEANKKMLSLAHKEKNYYDNFEHPILRDRTTLEPNEIWVGDQMQFDVLVQYTGANGKRQVARPWLSAWLDIRTGLWTGMMVSLTPTSRAIADALRTGILRFGVPMNIYIDNGKTYRAKVLTGDRKRFDLQEIGRLDPGVEVWNAAETLARGLYGRARVIHAIIENARAKLVERFFGKGNWADWAKEQPGYTGDRYDRMPDETRRLVKAGKLMTAEEFLWRVAQFIQEMNTRPSKGQGMGGMSPAQMLMWYARERGWRPLLPTGDAARFIDHLALNSEERIVQKTGIQHASKPGDPVYYWDDALAYKQLETKVVNIRWGESDLTARRWFTGNVENGTDGYSVRLIPSKLIVYHAGEFVCEAEPIQMLEYLDDPRLQEAMIKQRETKKHFKELRDKDREFGAALTALPPGTQEIVPAPVLIRPVQEDDFERELREARQAKSYLDILKDTTRPPEDDDRIIEL